MERLPHHVRIEAYIESTVDDGCRDQNDDNSYADDPASEFTAKIFLEEIMRRNAKIGFVKPETPHVIIVDQQNVRIEFDRDKADDADCKRALIYYYETDLADTMTEIVAQRVC